MAFLAWLLLPFSLIDKVLLLLVTANDKLVYSPLQLYLIPLVAKIPREVTLGGARVTVFTANGVTFTRTSLVVIMAACLKHNYTVSACLLVLLNDFMDHLDGIVAKAQRKVYGNVDSPLLGAFVDAFCDKVVNVFLLWTVLLLTDLSDFGTYQFITFVGVCSSVICFESVLGVIRVQDYFQAKYNQNNTEATPTPSVAVTANMQGKTKEKLENVGLSFVCLGMAYTNPMDTWVGCIGIACLALSLRFAYASLMHKLNARRKVAAASADSKVQSSTDLKSTRTDEVGDSVFESSHQNGFIACYNGYARGPTIKQLGYLPKVQSSPAFRLDSSSSDSDDLIGHCSDVEQDRVIKDEKVDKIYTVGCFDLFHRGHKKLLKNMRNLGKEVIVGIHNDESYYKLKKKIPIDDIEKRMTNVKQYAEQVFVISSTDPAPYLTCCIHLQPGQTAMYVRGDDMPHFPGRHVVEPLMPVQLLPYTQGVSSTQLRAELMKNCNERTRQTVNDKLKTS